MLAFLAVILILFWAIGLGVHLFGGLINIALVVGIILAIAHFFTRRSPGTV
jgi:hypothetical protein